MNQYDAASPITIVITSCGRLELLERTIKSFFEQNTLPVRDIILIDDSCNKQVYQKLEERYGERFTLLLNEEKLGQIRSIDKAYEQVKTEYIFHCEDDWEFTRSGFIEESALILERDPSILQVWLRDVRETLHHVEGERHFYSQDSFFCKVAKTPYDKESGKFWGGFSFNPGLRRTIDYRKLAPYSGVGHELEISMQYSKLGYFAVCLGEPAVVHTGDGYHVVDTTVKTFSSIARLEAYFINILTRAHLALVIRAYLRVKAVLSLRKK